ncbi:MAG: hypothetical protein CMM01_27050 [Rhodopirellula sp.]|nr:hypothetical protein [Rhodopirellula sp.]
MLRIKLVFRNGIHEGKHVVLSKEKFVIGRSTKADLLLNSNRVSRHHCLIWCRENSVAVEDLGSRNGVRLNGKVMEPHQPYRVAHGDNIDVAQWRFTMSIRDKASNASLEYRSPAIQALRPTAESTDAAPNESIMLSDVSGRMSEVDLWLNELEQLAVDAPPLHQKIKSPVSEQRRAESMDTKEEVGSTSETLLDPVMIPDASEKTNGASGEVSKSGEGAAVAMRETQSIEDDNEESDENKVKTPGKLPSHLRPAGPVDSVEAADQALKRLFG